MQPWRRMAALAAWLICLGNGNLMSRVRQPFDRLVTALARLPGVGRRTAERMATRLVLDGDGLLPEMVEALEGARSEVCCCSNCGALTARHTNPCRICAAEERGNGILCVVEEPGDVLQMERSDAFNGRYHVLMGRVSASRGEAHSDLNIEKLISRIAVEHIVEVILATSTDVEGDATAAYVEECLRPCGVKVSRLAFGLPARSGIGYSDPVTLSRALRGRMPVEQMV